MARIISTKSVWPKTWPGRTPGQARRPEWEDWQQLLTELAANRDQIQLEEPYIDVLLVPGKPYNKSLRIASSISDPFVIGIAETEHTLRISGILELEGLIPESIYYLGHEELVTEPPQTGWLVQVGQSINTTQLVVDIKQPIRL